MRSYQGKEQNYSRTFLCVFTNSVGSGSVKMEVPELVQSLSKSDACRRYFSDILLREA